MIHGILHLMGNDDDTPENKAHMRALETQALEKRDVILLTNR
jgi:ssRNA-specific RNase YbeY (16S rRNA maturation enzyme)